MYRSLRRVSVKLQYMYSYYTGVLYGIFVSVGLTVFCSIMLVLHSLTLRGSTMQTHEYAVDRTHARHEDVTFSRLSATAFMTLYDYCCIDAACPYYVRRWQQRFFRKKTLYAVS